jgi:hypothetical protein
VFRHDNISDDHPLIAAAKIFPHLKEKIAAVCLRQPGPSAVATKSDGDRSHRIQLVERPKRAARV